MHYALFGRTELCIPDMIRQNLFYKDCVDARADVA
jgi:hypothetical protein